MCFFAVCMPLIYVCEKALTEGISARDKDGWREGETKLSTCVNN